MIQNSFRKNLMDVLGLLPSHFSNGCIKIKTFAECKWNDVHSMEHCCTSYIRACMLVKCFSLKLLPWKIVSTLYYEIKVS